MKHLTCIWIILSLTRIAVNADRHKQLTNRYGNADLNQQPIHSNSPPTGQYPVHRYIVLNPSQVNIYHADSYTQPKYLQVERLKQKQFVNEQQNDYSIADDDNKYDYDGVPGMEEKAILEAMKRKPETNKEPQPSKHFKATISYLNKISTTSVPCSDRFNITMLEAIYNKIIELERTKDEGLRKYQNALEIFFYNFVKSKKCFIEAENCRHGKRCDEFLAAVEEYCNNITTKNTTVSDEQLEIIKEAFEKFTEAPDQAEDTTMSTRSETPIIPRPHVLPILKTVLHHALHLPTLSRSNPSIPDGDDDYHDDNSNYDTDKEMSSEPENHNNETNNNNLLTIQGPHYNEYDTNRENGQSTTEEIQNNYNFPENNHDIHANQQETQRKHLETHIYHSLTVKAKLKNKQYTSTTHPYQIEYPRTTTTTTTTTPEQSIRNPDLHMNPYWLNGRLEHIKTMPAKHQEDPQISELEEDEVSEETSEIEGNNDELNNEERRGRRVNIRVSNQGGPKKWFVVRRVRPSNRKSTVVRVGINKRNEKSRLVS